MRTEHTYFEKIRSGKIAGTETFGMVTLDFPGVMPLKAKSVHGKSYFGSDGDVLPIIDKVRYEAYEFTAKFGYKGARGTGVRAMMSFIHFLTGRENSERGILMRMASGITNKEYRNVRFVSFSPELIHVGNDGDIITASITFRVGDPNVVEDNILNSSRINVSKKYFAVPSTAPEDDWGIYYEDNGQYRPISSSMRYDELHVTDVPLIPQLKAKSVYVNNWPDEDGEQIYDAGRLDFESFEYKMKVACSNPSYLYTFVNKLRSVVNKPNLIIEDRRSGIRYKGAYLESLNQELYGITNRSDQTAVAELTFKINEIVSW